MTETDNSKIIEEMRRYYDARAPWHDRYMSYKSNEQMEELLRPMIGIIENLVTGKRVLEIACGTGNWTEVLAQRAASVTAIDSSPASLALARSKLAHHQNVTLMESDAYCLKDITDSYQLLFSADWWSHVPKSSLAAFLDSALSRILPGSKAIFTDMTLIDYFRQEACHYDDDNNRISVRRLPDGSEFNVIKNFPSESELKNTLAHYGQVVAYHESSQLGRWLVILEKS